MKCKYCQAELDENVTVCPVCGQAVEETAPVAAPETPAPQEQTWVQPGVSMTPGKIAAVVIGCVLVLAVLVGLLVWGAHSYIYRPLPTTEAPTQAPSEPAEAPETAPATVPADGNPDDVTCKGTYTVTDGEAAAANGDIVATMGDVQLTNGQLQAYYWAEVFGFLSQYGNYAMYLGLDVTQPLDTQMCSAGETPMTWQQFFLDSALSSWHAYQALALEGAEHETVLSQEFQDQLDNLESDLLAMAAESGYETVDEMLLHIIGPGGTLADYAAYMDVYFNGYMYFGNNYESIQPTDEEIAAYFAANEAGYAENGITKDGIYVDVRHVLIMPEGGTTDENGTTTYSDEEWEACRVKAQEIYDAWLAGEMTEDSFAALAAEHSVDSSAANGGLYENVYVGQMVPEFNDWCFDETRAVGDHGLVKTKFGYHIMYFSGSREIWYTTAKQDFIEERASALVPEAMEKYPVEIDYSAIKLGFIDLVEG